MKKFTTMLLVVAMVLSLAACGSEQSGNEGTGETPLQILETVWGT